MKVKRTNPSRQPKDYYAQFKEPSSSMKELDPAVRRWLSKNGEKGGASKSKAKQEAARENGKLGGAPRKQTQPAAPQKQETAS